MKLGFGPLSGGPQWWSLALTQANTVMTSWFYWSEAHRNVKGEELATCLTCTARASVTNPSPASFEAGVLVVVHARCTRVVVTD